MDIVPRIDDVLKTISGAAARCGRDPASITLVAVSKTVPAEIMQSYADSAARRGLFVAFGESYVQELKSKLPSLRGAAEIHIIGPLQSNKVKDAVRLSDVIESVQSLKILDLIAKEARVLGKRQRIFLQVNISDDTAKSGFRPAELNSVLEHALAADDALDLEGLMTITALYDDPSSARLDFRAMRELRDQLADRLGRRLKLSMGMSSDYAEAIEEGADLVRVGSALFGERVY